MNREIKYQAFARDDKRVYRVLYIDFLNDNVGVIVDEDRGTQRMLSTNEFVLRQFTGLTDGKGRDIYEGDVVRVNSDRYMDLGANVKFQGVVCMDGAGWRLKGQDYRWLSLCDQHSLSSAGAENDDRFDDAEVIGNVYEHQHLLMPSV